MIEFNFTLVMTWINFLILYFALRHLLFLPILELQEKRHKQAEASIKTAEAGTDEVLALEKQYQEKLLTARSEAHGVLHQARQEAIEDRKQRRASVENEVTRQIESSQVLAEKELQEARKIIPQKAFALASQIMEKMLGRPLGHAPDKSLASMEEPR